jgi:hypothetical protein
MLLAGLAHPGPSAFLGDYLGDEAHPVPFVGRVQDREALSAWLVREDGPDRAIVAASAGRGKSALLVRFVAGLDAAGYDVAWVPVSLRFGTHRSQTVDALLTARLGALRGTSGHWKVELAADGERPLLVVLDGLDELQDPAFLDALVGLRLGRGVRILVAARTLLDRDGAGWAARLGWPSALLFEPGPLSLTEITAALPSERAAEAPSLLARTGGDPLLLRLCLEALAQGEDVPASDDPLSLVGAWWEAQQAALPAPRNVEARRALAALAASCGVVPWEILAEVTGDDEATLRQAFATFARFVRDVPEQGVTFAHPRFAEVAVETLPTEVAAMRARFAERASLARAGDDPPAYFLHFALAHLIAAGAPDEAFARLVTRSSLLAWRRLEGDVHGLRNEAEALVSRTAITVAASAPGEAGHPAALRALEHVVFVNELVELLQDIEETMTPALRTAQVTAGLRSPASALASVLAVRYEQGSQYELDDLLRPLLPHLPDDVLPGLLAVARQRNFPHREVVTLLQARGLPALAFEVLRFGSQLLGQELVALVPSLSAAEATHVPAAAEAIVDAAPRSLWGPTLQSVWAALSLLPETRAEAVFARVEGLWVAAEKPREDELEAAIHVCGARAVALAGGGDDEAALAALEPLEPLFARSKVGDEPERIWGALTKLADALGSRSPTLGAHTERLVDTLTHRLEPTADGWVPLLLWRSRADWWARAQNAANEVGFRLALARRERGHVGRELPLPDPWRARVEAAVVAKLRADLLAEHLPYEHDLETYALRSREACLELLPIWLERAMSASDSRVACFCRVLARQGRAWGDGDGERGGGGNGPIRAALDELAARGEPVWEIPEWEELWPIERRRELIRAHLAEPPWLPEREQRAEAVAPRSRRQEVVPGSQASRRLRKRLARAIGAHSRRSLATLLACSPASEHPALLDELLFSDDELDYFDRYYLAPASNYLLRLIEDPALRGAAARHLLAHQDAQPLRHWPAVALASLPPAERPAAERALVEHLAAHELGLPGDTPHEILFTWAQARSAAGASWVAIATENRAVIRVPALRDPLVEAALTELEAAGTEAGGRSVERVVGDIVNALVDTLSPSELTRALRHPRALPWLAVRNLLGRPAIRPLLVGPVLAELGALAEGAEQPGAVDAGEAAAATKRQWAGLRWLASELDEGELAAVEGLGPALVDRFPADVARSVTDRVWRLLCAAHAPSAHVLALERLLDRTATREDAPFESRLRQVLWAQREAPVEDQAAAILALRTDEEWGLQKPPPWGSQLAPAAQYLCWPLARLGRPGLAKAVLLGLLDRRPLAEHRANLAELWEAIDAEDRPSLVPVVEAAVRATVDERWGSREALRSMMALVSEESAKAIWAARPDVLADRLDPTASEDARVRGLVRAYAVFGFELSDGASACARGKAVS